MSSPIRVFKSEGAALIVYGLIDPRSGELRYVGKSTTGMVRPRKHGQPGTLKWNRGHSGAWLRSLARDGLAPEIIELERAATRSDLAAAEQFQIAYWRFVGADLTNLTIGGEGASGRRVDAALRAKLSAAARRTLAVSPESRTRAAASLKARHANDPAMKARFVARCLSATVGDAKWMKRITEKNRQLARDPSWLERTAAANRAKASDPTWIAKVRAAAARSARPIVDQHGTRYASAGDAARTLGLSPGNVALVAQGRRRHAGGYVFRYVEAP